MKKLSLFLIMLFSAIIFSKQQAVFAATGANDLNPNLLANGSETPVLIEAPNPHGLRTTVTGEGGYSKLWVSGGRVYMTIKMYSLVLFPVYFIKAVLHLKMSNGKPKTLSITGNGVGGQAWTSYRTYTKYGSHGSAYLSGTAVSGLGITSNILKPTVAF